MKLLEIPKGPSSAKRTVAVCPDVSSLQGQVLTWFGDFVFYFFQVIKYL